MRLFFGAVVGMGAWTTAVLLLLFLNSPCEAGELNLVLDGWSKHFNSNEKYNEHHRVKGMEYITDGRAVYTGVILRDSYGHPSWYIGAGKYWPLFDYNHFRVSWGGIIAAAKHTNLNDGEPGGIILPFVEVKYKKVAFNFTGVPKLDSNGSSVMAVEFKMQIN